MKGILELAKYAGLLKKVKRAGWVRIGIANPESVAEHSFRLGLLVMAVGDQLGLDSGKLVKMALLDDLAESIVGDLVSERGNKTLIDHDTKIKKERRALRKILSSLKNGNDYLKLWKETQEGVTQEARLLKQVDKLEMAIQALEYEGEVESRKLDEFWINVKEFLKDQGLIELFEKLATIRIDKKDK